MTDDQMIWPTPFGSITCVAGFANLEQMRAAIIWLSGEGITCKRHFHNLAASFYDLQIYTTELGGHCIEAFAADWCAK
jgi:hypothetical protein